MRPLIKLTRFWPAVLPHYQSSKRMSSKVLQSLRTVRTRTFFWLKAATTAFTFKNLLKHHAKHALTQCNVIVKSKHKIGSLKMQRSEGSFAALDLTPAPRVGYWDGAGQ